MSEEVLVFPRDIIPPFHGMIRFSLEFWSEIVKSMGFISRDKAEVSQEFKQIIPYCVIFCQNKVLSYRRMKKAKEARLQELYSIGIGGHVNPVDLSGKPKKNDEIIYICAEREIEEELGISIDRQRLDLIGFLNDDTNPVGFVHFGVVFKLELSEEERQSLRLEDTMGEVEFVDLGNALENRKYETWSSLLIDYLRQNWEVVV